MVLGDLDASILRASTRYANVMAILRDDEKVHSAARDIIETIESIKTEDLRGFRLASKVDVNGPGPIAFRTLNKALLDDDTLQSLRVREDDDFMLNEEVTYILQISVNGICYGMFDSTYYWDSSIIFSNNSSRTLMGVISKVFQYGQNWYLLIKHHQALSHQGLLDPYLKYGFAAGFLCEVSAHTQYIDRVANDLWLYWSIF